MPDPLTTPVQFLKGVGPARAELLEKLNLRTARDLLFYFPRDYQDLTHLASLDELAAGELVRLRGRVTEIDQRSTASGRSMLGVLVDCGGRNLRCVWFNQPYMLARFAVGQDVLLVGKAKDRGGIWEMSHPQVQWIDADAELPGDQILPLYPLTEGVRQSDVRRAVAAALERCVDVLDEAFPDEFLKQHELWPLREALPAIHFPANRDELARARRRFVYQELFVLQLALAVRQRKLRDDAHSPPLEADARIDARIRRLFPFELTPGQQQAIAEVRADMARAVPMNRLLQGDVGSGKTVVAVYALLTAVAHGYQAALMAPTEVLARQHTLTLESLLAASRVRWLLLSGGLSAKARQTALEQIAAGEIDVVIGTQAILAAGVEFAKLGLVVIDEQHKFGVRQRAQLRHSSLDPHYLVMTATPIPRTVAMTLFGDLEVSTIRDMPPGRPPVHTYLQGDDRRDAWWEFVANKLREGRQAYVIVPLVEGADEDDVASLTAVYESLANGPLEAFRLGLLHGRMTPGEKESAMADFRAGRTQVLVATTVVEVGVDVPNATLLTIEGGERFGLAQLHQLRGRIGRGTHTGYCCVFADLANDEARRRLQAFEKTTDGFALAEEDFRHRGPGDLLGTRQHGLPPLMIADLTRDAEVLEVARRDARALVELDPGLSQPQHARLRRQVLARYGQVLELGDVG